MFYRADAVCICGSNGLFAFRCTIKFNACVLACVCAYMHPVGWLLGFGWLMTNGKGDKNRFQPQRAHTQGTHANANAFQCKRTDFIMMQIAEVRFEMQHCFPVYAIYVLSNFAKGDATVDDICIF